MGKIVNDLPPQMGTWIWEYTPGHGYTGRHAYSESNPELSLPVRQIYEIRKNPDRYKEIIDASLNRRDIILRIDPAYEWNHRTWRAVSYQFSTGALRFIQHLNPATYMFVTVTGIPQERYFTEGMEQDATTDSITRTISGYTTASYYANTGNFYQRVVIPAYNNFEPVEYFTVHYEV